MRGFLCFLLSIACRTATDQNLTTAITYQGELDFGVGVFIGEDRWLELRIREGSSAGGFTGLLPGLHPSRCTQNPSPRMRSRGRRSRTTRLGL